jgi:hypothetical protein
MDSETKLIALYWYCADYADGQNSWQYKYISQNPHYNPGPLRTRDRDFEEDPEIKEHYLKLQDKHEWRGGLKPCTNAIAAIQENCKKLGIFEDILEESGEDTIEIRIQYLTGQFTVHWGDPQYDMDHSGKWAYGTLSEENDPRELAVELLNQWTAW